MAKVGKTMTAMIYEQCTLVTLPFIPPALSTNVNTICHKTGLQCKAHHSVQWSHFSFQTRSIMEPQRETGMKLPSNRLMLQCESHYVILGRGNGGDIYENLASYCQSEEAKRRSFEGRCYVAKCVTLCVTA